MEINKEYAIDVAPKLWDLGTIKTDVITITAASKDLPKGTILSLDKDVYTPVTTALTGKLFIVAEDVAKNATKAKVLVAGLAYLDGLNAVNETEFTITNALVADWAGVVGIISNEEVTYAN